MKKLMAALLAVAMVCAMAIPAFADSSSSTGSAATTKYTITAPKNGHTYEIYQIFTGDYDPSNKTMLTNIKWGKNGKGGAVGDAVDQAILNELSGVVSYASDHDKLAVIEKYVTLTNPVETIVDGGSVEVDGGYYLIKDQDGSLSGSEPYTTYLVSVVGTVNISPKSNAVPEFKKKLKDTNDSTGDVSGWQDSADYDIGDTIPYQLTATLGNVSNFDTYYVEFVDTMDHLTYNSITSVKVDDTTLTAGQYKPTWDAAKKELTVSIDDVKQYGATNGSKIIVEYTAILDSDAVIGSTGNPNTAYLIFSNNPNGTGTGKTAPDKNIVFTYKVVANKIDENDKPLPGAAFALYKKLPAVPTNGTSYVLQDNEPYALIKELNVGVGGKVENETRTNFEWDGIDDGDYMIKEIITPAGYNSIEPITFKVEAAHDTLSDNPQLTELKGGDKFTGSVDNSSLTISIQTRMGSTLPGTGGIGTTIFYVIGGGLMVAAAILLITKKRMENH